MRTFVDTGIWLAAVDGSDPERQARARDALVGAGGDVVVSAHVLGELYEGLITGLALDPSVARDLVERAARQRVADGGGEQVLAAIDGARAWGLAYPGALVVASARSAGCALILSDRLGHGAAPAGIAVRDPLAHPESDGASGDAQPFDADARTWDDAGLRRALGAYEAACRAAGMRPSAVHSYWDYARRFLDWREGTYRPRGISGFGRPVARTEVDADALTDQAAGYAAAIARAGRGGQTVDTYHRHALFFIRWLRGEFVPGGRLTEPGRRSPGAAL